MFHDDDRRYLAFLIPEGPRVLEIGGGTGGLLAALNPAAGIDVDIFEAMIVHARAPGARLRSPRLEDPATIARHGPFDVT